MARMMFVGDSNVEGYIDGQGTFRYFLHEHFLRVHEPIDWVGPWDTPVNPAFQYYRQGEWNHWHAGVSGETTIGCEARIGAQLTTYNPDTIVLMTGTNDLRQASFSWAISTIMEQYGTLLDTIIAASPDIQIVALSAFYGTEIADARIDAFNSELAILISNRTTAQNPMVYVDLSDGWNKATMMEDSLHPNPFGEEVIAGHLADTLYTSYDIGYTYDNWERYNVQLYSGGSLISDVETEGLLYDFTNLTAETPYEWRVRRLEGEYSGAWSADEAFNTTAEAPPATYDVEWRVVGASELTGSVFGVEGTYHDITGLIPSTEYEWRVRSVEGALTGYWSDFQSFNTVSEPGSPTTGYALATISNPSAAMTDFSLIVDLSRMPASWWSAVDTTDGTRGRVYKGDGSTRLACDWIDFDDTAETGLLRVLWSGTLATTGTQQLWIEPPVTGNATVAANATYGSDNAYDEYWAGYWPDAGLTDRTSNGNDGTAQGGVTAGGTTGIIGDGTDFDGTDDYISVPNADNLSLNTTNGNSWFYAYNTPADVTAGGRRSPMAKYQSINPFLGEWYLSHLGPDALGGEAVDGGAMLQLMSTSTTARHRAELNTALTNSAWNTVGWAWDGALGAESDITGVLNGSSVALTESQTSFNSVVNRDGIVTIGAGLVDSINAYTDGPMSHVSFHGTERPVAWFTQEDAQLKDQATFYGTWSWETGTSNPYLDKLLSLNPDWVLGYNFRTVGTDRIWDDESGAAGDYDIVLEGGTERTESGPTNDPDARWVYFDSTEDNYGVATEGISGLTDFTMAAWVRTPNRDQSNNMMFGCWPVSPDRSWGLQFRGTSATHGTRYAIIYSTSGSNVGLISTTTGIPANNTWDHIIVTRSGDTVTWYRNGESAGTSTQSATFFSAAIESFNVGAEGNGIGLFDGDVYAPAMWTSALTATEVEELYDASSATDTSVLSISDLSHAHSMSTPSLLQYHFLTAQGISHSQAIDNVALTQNHIIAMNSMLHTHSLDNVALSQFTLLSINNLLQSQTIGEPLLTQIHNLSVQELSHIVSLGSVSLSQAHSLSIDSMSHEMSLDSVSLSLSSILAINNLSHAMSIGGDLPLDEIHNLIIESLSHSNTLSVIDLIQFHILQPNSLYSGQTLDTLSSSTIIQGILKASFATNTTERLVTSFSVEDL